MQKAFGISNQECLDMHCESTQIVLKVHAPEQNFVVHAAEVTMWYVTVIPFDVLSACHWDVQRLMLK